MEQESRAVPTAPKPAGLVIREARRADLPAVVRMLAADVIRPGTAPATGRPGTGRLGAGDLGVGDLGAGGVGAGEPSGQPSGAGPAAPGGGWPGEELAEGYAAAFAEIDADPRAMLLVGELDGEVVATCQLNFLRYLIHAGGLIAQVEAVRTVSHLRGQGIGRALMLWVVEESKRRGATRLQLTSNVQRTDAHRFYERLGFVRSHVGMKLYLEDPR